MLQKSHKKYDIDVDPSKNYITDVKEDSRGNHVRVISYIFLLCSGDNISKKILLLSESYLSERIFSWGLRQHIFKYRKTSKNILPLIMFAPLTFGKKI